MANLGIGGTFTVSTVEDGENAFEVGLDRTSIGVECDTEGNISETVSFLVTISAHYGSENVVGACSITDNHEDVDSDISVEYDTSEPWVAEITFTQGNMLASMLNIAFTVTHPTYGTRVVALAINRIVLGKDGTNAPFYNEEWYAWSNDSSTASVTTEPTISGSWSHSIPNQGSSAYLWKKIIRYNYNASIKDYVQDSAQYYRMSGTNGTSINTKGTIKVAITASGTFPTSGFSNGNLGVKQGDSYMWQFNGSSWSHVSSASSDGDSYTMTKDCTIDLDGDGTSENIKGHLIQWNTEASKWIDLGQFKGESGVTYYTHIAWATGVTLNPSPSTKPAGQQNIPNASDVQGFVIVPSGADLPWMGYLIDTNVSDSTTYLNYTWSKTKGVKGDAAVVYKIEFEKNTFAHNLDTNKLAISVQGTVYKIEGATSTSIALTNGNFRLYKVAGNTQVRILPTLSNSVFSYTSDTDFNNETLLKAQLIIDSSVVATECIQIVTSGARGKVGRFYYYSGFDWNPNDNDPTHKLVVNDAQVPYFSKAGSNADKYYVFNPETIPTGGEMTMAQMAAATTVGGQIQWNSAPWEVMTDDFKYLITEAIFAQFAQFGSAIISGDWMISKYGVIYDTSGVAHTIDGSSSWGEYNANNAYKEFNPEYPNSSKYGEINFAPNYAVDLLTGTTYQKKAYIEGVLHASAFYNRIGGFIEEDGKTWLDLDNNNGNTYILGVSGQTYYLPTPNLYEGMELNIWLKRSTRIATVLREGAEAYLDKIVITTYQGDSAVSGVFLAEAIKSTLLGDEIQLLKIQAIDITHASGFRDIRWVVTSQRGLIEAFANASDSSGRLITPEGKFFVRSDAETALYHDNKAYRFTLNGESDYSQGTGIRVIQN